MARLAGMDLPAKKRTEIGLTYIYRIGRTRSKSLCYRAGINPDNRGRLTVNQHFQTEIPNIYAVGDVIGFPALASTSMEQGRLAACHAFSPD